MPADHSSGQISSIHLHRPARTTSGVSAASSSTVASLPGQVRTEKRKRKRQLSSAISTERRDTNPGPSQTGEQAASPPTESNMRTDKKRRTISIESGGNSSKGARDRKKRRKLSLSAAGDVKPSLPSSSRVGSATHGPATVLQAAGNENHQPDPDVDVETKDQIIARLTARASTGPVKLERPPHSAHAGSAPKSLSLTKQIATIRDSKITQLQRQLKAAQNEAEIEKAAWEREKESLNAQREELEKQLEEQAEKAKADAEGKDRLIQDNVSTLEKIREAVSCGVCLDTLKDPHILSCGHIACKDCLTSWFRTPVAFMHELPDLGDVVPAERDVSYRTKVCHVCRVAILRRPSRMYHFDSILEPLGINPHLPTASQEAADDTDPWYNLFPVERETYRIFDQDDGIPRCPECLGEIDGNVCDVCDIEFSEDEDDGYDEGQLLSEGSEVEGDDDDGEGDAHGDDSDDDEAEAGANAEDRLHYGGSDGSDHVEAYAAPFDLAAELAADDRVNRQIAHAERRIRRQRNTSLFDLEAIADDDEEDEESENEGQFWDGNDDERPRDRQRSRRGEEYRWHSGSSAGTDTDAESDQAEPAGRNADLTRLADAAQAGAQSTADIRRANRARAQEQEQDRQGRRAIRPGRQLSDDEEEEEDEDLALEADEQYESSFINDEDDEEDEEGTGEAGEQDDRSGDEEVGSEKEVYDPAAVRQRRLARFDQAQQRSVSPVIRSSASSSRRKNRAVIDPDSDSD